MNGKNKSKCLQDAEKPVTDNKSYHIKNVISSKSEHVSYVSRPEVDMSISFIDRKIIGLHKKYFPWVGRMYWPVNIIPFKILCNSLGSWRPIKKSAESHILFETKYFLYKFTIFLMSALI